MMLGLQHSVGNQTVSSLIARRNAEASALLFRDATDEMKDAGPDPAGPTADESKDDEIVEQVQSLEATAGTDAPEGGGGDAAGPAAPLPVAAPADSAPRQPSNDLEAIYAQAAESLGAFTGTVSGIASAT